MCTLYLAQMALGDLQWGGGGQRSWDIQPTSHMYVLYIAHIASGDLQWGVGDKFFV